MSVQPAGLYLPHEATVWFLRGSITPYATFHEYAHLDQHSRRTAAWRMFERWRETPVLCRLAQLLVEIEAAWIARREMRACGVWREGDGAEALQGLLSYAVTIFCEKK